MPYYRVRPGNRAFSPVAAEELPAFYDVGLGPDATGGAPPRSLAFGDDGIRPRLRGLLDRGVGMLDTGPFQGRGLLNVPVTAAPTSTGPMNSFPMQAGGFERPNLYDADPDNPNRGGAPPMIVAPGVEEGPTIYSGKPWAFPDNPYGYGNHLGLYVNDSGGGWGGTLPPDQTAGDDQIFSYTSPTAGKPPLFERPPTKDELDAMSDDALKQRYKILDSATTAVRFGSSPTGWIAASLLPPPRGGGS